MDKDKKMTKEIIEKAKKARSTDELMAMANAYGIELEKSKAEEIFALINKGGEISDDELCSVAGGFGPYYPYYPDPSEFKDTDGSC